MKILVPMLVVLVAAAAPRGAAQPADPGKDELGKIRTELLFGTNGEPGALGKDVPQLSEAEQRRLAEAKSIPDYRHFVRLGSDVQPILRGYKNWAAPISNSEAIMVTFQPQGLVGKTKRLRMDLELWQNKKMVLRTDPVLDIGKRVYILGPKWRGGNLIITVELVSLTANQ